MVATTHVSLALRRESAEMNPGSLGKATWLNRVSPDGEFLFIPDKKDERTFVHSSRLPQAHESKL